MIGTEIFPDLSHSKSNSRSGMKFFDERRRPKNVVRLPDQKNRFLDNSLRIAGNFVAELRNDDLVHLGHELSFGQLRGSV